MSTAPKLEALRAAYRSLSDTQKRDIFQASLKVDPELFTILAEVAHLSGWRAQAVANRPKEVAAKLDHALLRPPTRGPNLLPWLVSLFFIKEHFNWGDDLSASLAGADASTLESTLNESLAVLQAAHGKHEFWPLFDASVRFRPEKWLKISQTSGPAAELEPDSAAAESTGASGENGNQSPCPSATTEDNLQQLEGELALARQGKSFDVKKTTALVTAISEAGLDLRNQLYGLASVTGESPRDWQSLSELRDLIAKLETLRSTQVGAADARKRLHSVRAVLQEISAVKHRLRAKREAAMQLMAKAIKELETAAAIPHPPALPGHGGGKDWLRDIYQLEGEPLERAVEQLGQVALNALADFIADTVWGDLVFRTEEDTATAAATPGLASSTPHPAASETPPSAPPPVLPEGGEATSASAEPSREDAPSVAEEQHDDTPEQSAIIEPAAAGAAADSVETPVVSAEPIPETAPSPDTGEALYREVAADFCLRRNWAVAGHLLELTGRTPELPAPALFTILELTPHLRQPHGPLTERIRAELAKVGSISSSLSEVSMLLWFSALFPAALLAPASTAAAFLRLIHLPDGLSRLRKAGIALAEHVPQCSMQLLRGAQPRLAWETRLREIATAAVQFKSVAAGQTILYQPATAVWQHLNRQGVFAELGNQIAIPAGKGNRTRVAEILKETEPGKSLNRLIQDTHLLFATKKKVCIEARAIPQFESKSRALRDLAAEWLTLVEKKPPASDFVGDRIREFRQAWPALAAEAQRHYSPQETAGMPVWYRAATLAVLSSLEFVSQVLDDAHSFEDGEPDPTELLSRRFLLIPSLDVDAVGRPTGSTELQLEAIFAYRTGVMNTRGALECRLERRDLVGARQLLGMLTREAIMSADMMRPLFEEKELKYRSELSQSLRSLRKQATNARFLGIIGESDAAAWDATVVTLEKRIREEDNLATIAAEIDLKRSELEQARKTGQEFLQTQVAQEVGDESARRRIADLIDAGDVITAQEYLARLRTGYSLPTTEASDIQPFAGFTPERQEALSRALDSAGGLEALKQAIRSKGAFAGYSFEHLPQERREYDCGWVDIWLALKRTEAVKDEDVVSLMTGLGFVVRSSTPGPRLAPHQSELVVEPLSDRALCPIPRFGSQTNGTVSVRHVWRRLDEHAIVQAIGDTAQHSALNIVFYYGRLPAESRKALARLCRAKRRGFLVLDEILLTHLCCQSESRLGTFFRAATPYTYADPFVTASSLVPPEMFFGRRVELDALMDSTNGRCFLYGGRQLGKTALLREAERRFHNPEEERHALWLDLLNHGLGRQLKPSGIWAILLREFQRWPHFKKTPTGLSHTEANAPEIVRRWLDENPNRRVLLLLDEADRFLDEDAKEDFAEARRLKGLMDSTARRFKVVFAGLHNVQRTTQQANHPLAHLGEPIVVGALSQNGEWQEAFHLAASPLAALGVSFASPDLVARILTLCNFYPGLLQQLCSRLWHRLLERRVDGPPFPVTEAELDEVYQDPDLRRDIVGRFKLTLQLDPRYWVLAYVFAVRFLEAPQEAEGGYPVARLRGMATDWWSEGFSLCSEEEFRSLLDEMCHLGVFRVTSEGCYSFRNANLLLLLGNKEEVEAQLLSGPRKVVDYTPRSFRARRKGKNNEPFLRRPLTLSDEGRALERRNGVCCVFGSKALGIDSVSSAFGEITAINHYVPVSERTPSLEEFGRVLTNEQHRTKSDVEGVILIWVSASVKWDMDWIAAAESFCQRLKSERRFIRVGFEMSADRIWDLPEEWHRTTPRLQLDQIVLRKWSDDFLQPWIAELGLPNGEEVIAQLGPVAGGWPDLLHEFARRHAQENDWRKATESLRNRPHYPRSEATLRFAGGGKRAFEAIELLRKIRQQQVRPEDDLPEADLPVYAEILGETELSLRQTIARAELLGLVDVVQSGIFRWDPVFERMVLS